MGVTSERALVTGNYGQGEVLGAVQVTQSHGAQKDGSMLWALEEPVGPGTGSLGRRKGFCRTDGEKNLVEIAKGLRVKVRDTSLYEEPLSLVHKSALNSNTMRQLLFQEALNCSCPT